MKLPFARALIVDDEPHSRMRVQLALEHVGFQCDVAADGDEALQRVAECRYHVVVTELILPRTNGGELVIQLRSQEWVPMLVVHTRELDQEVYGGLKREGVDAIFCKPADYGAMARSIQTLVEGRAAPRTALERLKKWQSGPSVSENNEVVRMLRRGDGWIQNSSVRVEAFRFLIIVLACMLLGLGWGNSLDSSMAGVCRMFGLCGFAFYFCLELVAYHREQHRTFLLRWGASGSNRGADQSAVQALPRPAAGTACPARTVDAC